jgi:hypothetical protein
MDLTAFFSAFASLLRMALTSGLQALKRPNIHPSELSAAEMKAFVAGCHRGYDKAQVYMVKLLSEVQSSATLSPSQKRRCEMLVRGVAETIALAMLADSAYMIRRLPLSDEPPHLNHGVLRTTLRKAQELNAESRQTFALLTDLTWSVHVADLLRIDFRRPVGSRFELIELKSGTINDQLEALLAGYELDASGLAQVDNDATIAPSYKKQAKRMLRQKIRLRQVAEVLSTDEGTDIKYKAPIRLSTKPVILTEYDELVQRLLQGASSSEATSGVVSTTMGGGVGVEGASSAEAQARTALSRELGALDAQLRSQDSELYSEVMEALDGVQPYSAFNLFECILGQVAVRPPTSWAISRDDMLRLAKREAVIFSGFHVVGFLRLARTLGLRVRFATRRETARLAQNFPPKEIPKWNERALIQEMAGTESPITCGLLSRFLYSLTEPSSFLTQMLALEEEASGIDFVEEERFDLG